ncbi:DedA family protein [Morganella morganii]|nr:DedA family protein [Morganella morganii]
METMQQLFFALWHQDYETLSNPSLLWAIYIMLFAILFLENGLLPAAFLPGDSLLILVGVLIAKDTLDFPTTLIILTAGASLGCWVGYLQGRWLSNTRMVKGWLSHLPPHYHQRAHNLFHRHGLAALLVGRFLAFVRTLLPMLAGIAGLNSRRFQFFNWLSGFLWVGILTSLGYGLGISPIFRKYEHHLMNILMLIPVVLLVFGLIASLWVVWKRKRTKPADDTHAQ